jgi:hypothetical protein
VEEQKPSGGIDNPEVPSSSADSPTRDVDDQIGSIPRDSVASEEKRPTLAERLTEAFREGVSAAKPDSDKLPEGGIPAPAKEPRQESSEGRILDRVIQEGRSAAAGVGDKTASALDSVVQMVKKAPDVTHKYAEAFREGVASVRPREGGERRSVRPPAAKRDGSPSEGRVVLDRMLHSVSSAAEVVRGAVANRKPGEATGARQKIRECEKKIRNLYVEIGREATNSWAEGTVETEKVAALLDELRKSEEEIQNLQEQAAMAAATRKMQGARSPQAAKGAVVPPATPPAPEPGVEAEAAPQEETSDRDLSKKE